VPKPGTSQQLKIESGESSRSVTLSCSSPLLVPCLSRSPVLHLVTLKHSPWLIAPLRTSPPLMLSLLCCLSCAVSLALSLPLFSFPFNLASSVPTAPAITHPLSLPPAPVPAHPSLTLTLSATLVLAHPHPHPHPPSLSPAIGHPLQQALPPSPSLVPSLVHPLPWALPHPPSHPVSPPPFLHTLSLSLSLPVHPLPHALAHTVGILQYNPIQLQKSGQSDFAK
jgi:hypothetical protein